MMGDGWNSSFLFTNHHNHKRLQVVSFVAVAFTAQIVDLCALKSPLWAKNSLYVFAVRRKILPTPSMRPVL